MTSVLSLDLMGWIETRKVSYFLTHPTRCWPLNETFWNFKVEFFSVCSPMDVELIPWLNCWKCDMRSDWMTNRESCMWGCKREELSGSWMKCVMELTVGDLTLINCLLVKDWARRARLRLAKARWDERQLQPFVEARILIDTNASPHTMSLFTSIGPTLDLLCFCCGSAPCPQFSLLFAKKNEAKTRAGRASRPLFTMHFPFRASLSKPEVAKARSATKRAKE